MKTILVQKYFLEEKYTYMKFHLLILITEYMASDHLDERFMNIENRKLSHNI